MASTLKEMQGWQIVNVDNEGKIINENRSRRSRTGNFIKHTFVQRISDGLSFGVGDNVITHDEVTKTYSVYLIHEIRQNTVKSLLEIWAFTYLRWFELNGTKYLTQFNPQMLEEYKDPNELNQKFFEMLDKNELYLTAELAEIQIADFIDLATILPKKSFQSGKKQTRPDKDFFVEYICEPTGENFVKIDIFKELKLIKTMPTKQSDEHLKRLSTQRMKPVSFQKKPAVPVDQPSNRHVKPLTAVAVPRSDNEEEEDVPLSVQRNRWKQKSLNRAHLSDSDDTSTQKSDRSDKSRNNNKKSDTPKLVPKKTKDNSNSASNNFIQREISEFATQQMKENDIFDDYASTPNESSNVPADNRNLIEASIKDAKKPASLFVLDLDTTDDEGEQQDVDHHETTTPTDTVVSSPQRTKTIPNKVVSPVPTRNEPPKEPVGPSNAIMESINRFKRATVDNDSDSEEKNKAKTAKRKIQEIDKVDNAKEEPKKSDTSNDNSDKKAQENGKDNNLGGVLVNPSTFKRIKTNYDKTLELINNFKNKKRTDKTNGKENIQQENGNTNTPIHTLIRYGPKPPPKPPRQTLYSQIKDSSNELSIELKLRSITRKREGLSDVCNAFASIYYSLFSKVKSSSSFLLFCKSKKPVSAEYILQEVFSELSLSNTMKELQPFNWSYISPVPHTTAETLVVQLWESISGENLGSKHAAGSLIQFCSNVSLMRKKYIIIVIRNFERILQAPNNEQVIGILMKLVQFPNSKMTIVGICSEIPQVLSFLPNSPNNKVWDTVNIETYPKNAIRMAIHDILYNAYYCTFFVKRDAESSNWLIRNMDLLISGSSDYDAAVTKATKDGYTTKQLIVSAADSREIITLLESSAKHYSDILDNCKKTIFVAKWNYLKGLTNDEISLTAEAGITTANVQTVILANAPGKVLERVRSLPAISRLVLISSLLGEDGKVSPVSDVIHFSKLRSRMIKYMSDYGNTLTNGQILLALAYSDGDLTEVLETVNWQFVFEKLKLLGLVNFSMKNEKDQNSIFFTIQCNRSELRRSLITCDSLSSTTARQARPTN